MAEYENKFKDFLKKSGIEDDVDEEYKNAVVNVLNENENDFDAGKINADFLLRRLFLNLESKGLNSDSGKNEIRKIIRSFIKELDGVPGLEKITTQLENAVSFMTIIEDAVEILDRAKKVLAAGKYEEFEKELKGVRKYGKLKIEGDVDFDIKDLKKDYVRDKITDLEAKTITLKTDTENAEKDDKKEKYEEEIEEAKTAKSVFRDFYDEADKMRNNSNAEINEMIEDAGINNLDNLDDFLDDVKKMIDDKKWKIIDGDKKKIKDMEDKVSGYKGKLLSKKDSDKIVELFKKVNEKLKEQSEKVDNVFGENTRKIDVAFTEKIDNVSEDKLDEIKDFTFRELLVFLELEEITDVCLASEDEKKSVIDEIKKIVGRHKIAGKSKVYEWIEGILNKTVSVPAQNKIDELSSESDKLIEFGEKLVELREIDYLDESEQNGLLITKKKILEKKAGVVSLIGKNKEATDKGQVSLVFVSGDDVKNLIDEIKKLNTEIENMLKNVKQRKEDVKREKGSVDNLISTVDGAVSQIMNDYENDRVSCENGLKLGDERWKDGFCNEIDRASNGKSFMIDLDNFVDEIAGDLEFDAVEISRVKSMGFFKKINFLEGELMKISDKNRDYFLSRFDEIKSNSPFELIEKAGEIYRDFIESKLRFTQGANRAQGSVQDGMDFVKASKKKEVLFKQISGELKSKFGIRINLNRINEANYFSSLSVDDFDIESQGYLSKLIAEKNDLQEKINDAKTVEEEEKYQSKMYEIENLMAKIGVDRDDAKEKNKIKEKYDKNNSINYGERFMGVVIGGDDVITMKRKEILAEMPGGFRRFFKNLSPAFRYNLWRYGRNINQMNAMISGESSQGFFSKFMLFNWRVKRIEKKMQTLETRINRKYGQDYISKLRAKKGQLDDETLDILARGRKDKYDIPEDFDVDNFMDKLKTDREKTSEKEQAKKNFYSDKILPIFTEVGLTKEDVPSFSSFLSINNSLRNKFGMDFEFLSKNPEINFEPSLSFKTSVLRLKKFVKIFKESEILNKYFFRFNPELLLVFSSQNFPKIDKTDNNGEKICACFQKVLEHIAKKHKDFSFKEFFEKWDNKGDGFVSEMKKNFAKEKEESV